MVSTAKRRALPARVLFADDDRSVRDAVARALRRHGLLVDLAVDGVEALALAREFPYAVVATDFRMPGLSASSSFRRCRRFVPKQRSSFSPGR